MKYEQNNERQDNLGKIASAAFVLGLGALALREGNGRQALSKALGDIGKTAKYITKDLSQLTRKEFDADNISKIAKTRILDEEGTWKGLRKSTNELDIRLTSNKSIFSSTLEYNQLFGGLQDVPGNSDLVKQRLFDGHIKNETMLEFQDLYKDKNKDFMNELNKLVDETLDRQESYFERGSEDSLNALTDEFKERIDNTILKGHEDNISNVITDKINNTDKELIYKNYEDNIKGSFEENFINGIVEEFDASKAEKGLDKVSPDRAATVNDIIAAHENGLNIKNSSFRDASGNEKNVMTILKELRDIHAEKGFGNLVVDREALRVNKEGEIFSLKDLKDTQQAVKEEFADTIIGKLFATRSMIEREKSPFFFHLTKGSFDPIMASVENSKSFLLKDDYFKIGSKFFKVTNDGLEHVKGADNLVLVSGKHGAEYGMIDRIAGNADSVKRENELLNKFDVGTTKGNAFMSMASKFTKFDNEDWSRNIVERILNDYPRRKAEEVTEESVRKYYKDVKVLNNLYNNATKAPDFKTIKAVRDQMSGESRGLLNTIYDDENIASSLLDKYSMQSFKNKNLKSLLNKYTKEIQSVDSMVHIGDKGSKLNGKVVLRYNDMLRREVFKEAILRAASSPGEEGQGFAMVLNQIKKSGLNGEQLKNAKDLANWAIIQNEGNLYSGSIHNPTSLQAKYKTYDKLNKLLSRSDTAQNHEFTKGLRHDIATFTKESTSILDSTYENKNVVKGYKKQPWMTMRKAINPLSIIGDINDNTSKQGLKQLYAGRNNMQDVTTATLFPYHYFNRLTTHLEDIGLGFSNANTGSVLDLVKGIGKKRILPVAGAIYGLSYLNYRTEAYTGTSLDQSYENSKSRFGLGVRKISGGLGLDDNLRRSREYNPFSKYLFGDYKDYNQYLDYLGNGYDPVRKGRFWSFGSASEYRGGKISFWEPTDIRQAYSHYKDVSLYGSVDEKWKHSLIPTPRHPLSILRAITNPSWLEKKHYWDRPYPVSGKMFSEGTPWGAVLNPTVGAILKPQRQMHQKELHGTLLDVRSLIAERNENIRQRSDENRLARMDDKGVTNIEYVPFGNASAGEAVYSLNASGGRLSSGGFVGVGVAGGVPELSNDNVYIPSGENISSVGGIAGSSTSNKMISNNYEDNKLNAVIANVMRQATAFVSSGAIEGSDAVMDIISITNSAIFSSSARRSESMSRAGVGMGGGVQLEKANLYSNSFRKANYDAKQGYLDNMVEMNSRKEYAHDLMYSASQLSGAYAFILGSILPNSKGFKLEQAGKMSSFSRTFWDDSVGGTGGDIMEIARRFFPHEDHNIEQINPIKNTMPEWMPVRFQTGDPYVKLPKGEARLPGAGYETLNKLHSDAYGRYGAFDRYKILADIAPLSEEFKTWKKIAKQSSRDPNLKFEMDKIERRAKEQIKEHDFFNYKFLGRALKSSDAVIKEVSDDGKFKVIGSEEQFTLAGVSPTKDKEGMSPTKNYLQAGMKISLQYENNQYRNRSKDGSIHALVFDGDQSISKKMFEDNVAKENDIKETLADEYFSLKHSNMAMGKFYEALGHAPVPYLHNKFWRIDSPLESYKKEQVYGTPFSTWGHPIKGFIQPAFQQSWARGPVGQALALGSFALSEYARKTEWDKSAKTLIHTAFALTNPGAFAGGMIGYIPKFKLGTASKWGARIGATVGFSGYALANLENPFLSAGNFAAIGLAAANQFKFKNISGKQGVLIGAAVGVGLSALKNPEFSLNKLTEKYIPKDTKKKWEVEEYFDRLEYLKYTNLYHKAARKARFSEGVNIEKMLNAYEYNKKKNHKKIEDLEEQKLKANKNIVDEQLKKDTLLNIDNQINELTTPMQMFRVGKYTKAALAYKKAADTTIHGLDEDSSVSDVLRALPKYDRDYFLEFANEKDPRARKKLLKYVSPYKAKALKVLWREDLDKEESNKGFFSNHALPGLFWSGWSPNVDLDQVKIKTIENEGMLLSDFGMYESQKSEPAALMAPSIRDIHSGSASPLDLQKNLLGLLHGAGFSDVDVSIEPTSSPGLNVISNVTRMTQYKLQNQVSSVLSALF